MTQSSRYCKFKYIDDKPLGVFQNFKYNILFKHKKPCHHSHEQQQGFNRLLLSN